MIQAIRSLSRRCRVEDNLTTVALGSRATSLATPASQGTVFMAPHVLAWLFVCVFPSLFPHPLLPNASVHDVCGGWGRRSIVIVYEPARRKGRGDTPPWPTLSLPLCALFCIIGIVNWRLRDVPLPTPPPFLVCALFFVCVYMLVFLFLFQRGAPPLIYEQADVAAGSSGCSIKLGNERLRRRRARVSREQISSLARLWG